MKVNNICNFNFSNIQSAKKQNRNVCAPMLQQLKCDVVSFTATGRPKFIGIDLLVIKKFDLKDENLSTNEDFQNWCRDEVTAMETQKCTPKRIMDNTVQSRNKFDEWKDFLTESNYSYSTILYVLDGVSKDIKNGNGEWPLLLDKDVARHAIVEIKKRALENRGENLSFYNLYKKMLFADVIKNENGVNKQTKSGWVFIHSKSSDEANYEANIKKLRVLSYDTWCTRKNEATSYLSRGDFLLYLKNGEAKLAIFINDKGEVEEIQGKKNNSLIPLKYLELVENVTKKYTKAKKAQKEFERTYLQLNKIKQLERKLEEKGVTFKKCSIKELFEAIGINYKVDKNSGLLILDEYRQPDESFTYEDIGIKEDNLFKNIVRIKDNVSFADSAVTNLGNLSCIDGFVDFGSSKVSNLGNLEYVGGTIYYDDETKLEMKNIQNLIAKQRNNRIN